MLNNFVKTIKATIAKTFFVSGIQSPTVVQPFSSSVDLHRKAK